MGLIQCPDNSMVKSPVISTSAAADFKSVGGGKKNHKFSGLQSIPETNSLLYSHSNLLFFPRA